MDTVDHHLRAQGTLHLAMPPKFLWALVCHKQSMVICITGINPKLLTVLQLDRSSKKGHDKTFPMVHLPSNLVEVCGRYC